MTNVRADRCSNPSDGGADFPEEKTSAARRRIALPPIPPLPLTPLLPVEDWGGDFDVPAVAYFRFEADALRAARALNSGRWDGFEVKP